MDFAPTAEIVSQTAIDIAALAQQPGVRAIQVDFDPTTSQRTFYAAVLKELRPQLPPGMPLSVTALVSWCADQSWLATLPADEAVPTLTYGSDAPFVRVWARGQDAVFSNCGDGKPRQFFGPGKPPASPPAPHLPPVLPAGTPLWLQQDRTYQLAAAQFYALDFDRAISSFRAIATDSASPWSVISRYLVARTLIREATVGKIQLSSTLSQAQQEFITMRAEARMAPMQNAIDNLLDYVNLRLQPEDQAVILAQRLQETRTRNFGQSLIDLTWLRTNHSDSEKAAPPHGPEVDPAGMIAWIDDINNLDQAPNVFTGEASPHTGADVAHATSDILQHWQTTRSTVWLVAALMVAKPADPATPSLIRAAAVVPASDPAYVSATYHRLRLTPADPGMRDQVLAVLPRIRAHENTSTLNQFISLLFASAPHPGCVACNHWSDSGR